MYTFQKTVEFLEQISQNNNRIWFDQHRAEYLEIKKDFESFVSNILVEVANFDESLRFLSLKDCVFRINRDVRFSKNKQPYKTVLGASFIHSGKNGSNPGYYLQIQPSGQIMIGGGWYMLDSKQISLVRQAIVKNPNVFRSILAEPTFFKTYGNLDDSANLKAHPKGYSIEDENIDLLRHTNFVVFRYINLNDISYDELNRVIVNNFKSLNPLVDFLRKVS